MQRKFASFLNGFDPMLGPALVESWLWQFQDADLQENALSLLEHIVFIEKSDIIAGFDGTATKQPELRDALWCPLRPKQGNGASADLVRYDLKGIAKNTTDIWAIDPKDIRSAKRLVFFDDLLNSGVQTECLLSSWFLGENGPCLNTGDRDKAGQLDNEKADAIRSVPVDFVFYSTHPTGVQRLRQICSETGLNLGEIYGTIDSSATQYTLAGFRGSSVKSRQRLLDHLQHRGELLLTEKHQGEAEWTRDQVTKFALGYGGLQMTLLYHHSVSTALPPALWQESNSLKHPWLPLFPRDSRGVKKILDPNADLRPSSVLPEYQSTEDM